MQISPRVPLTNNQKYDKLEVDKRKEKGSKMEKELRKVTFEFKDGTKRILTGKELEKWEVICMLHSDYLLPGDETHVLKEIYGGLVRGFFPA